MFKKMLLTEMDSNIVRDYILYVQVPHKRRSIGSNFRFVSIFGLVSSIFGLLAVHYLYILPMFILSRDVSIEVIVAFIILYILIPVTIVLTIVRCKYVVQKWEIDDSITEAERASHDAMKVARERLSGSIAGTLAISLQIKSRINPDGMPGEPIGMLILFVLTLAIIRLTTLCFYRYFLIKVHCPDLNEKNSEEEIDVFMKMEERNHLDIDNPESKD